MLRGWRGQCPHCGKGKLLKGYTQVADACPACSEHYGHIRADDGPAWLTILIVGHIFGAVALAVVPHTNWPDWLSLTVWPIFALAMILLVLPHAKGFFIALIWKTGCSGSER